MTPDPKTEALKPWHLGPAKGGENIWQDGDKLLIAVECSGGGTGFALVRISADEGYAAMYELDSGNPVGDWFLDDISYWIQVSDIPKLWSAPAIERDALAAMREALQFYADPDSYFAFMFMADSPCGEFLNDFDEEHGGDYDRAMPGKTARAALASNAGTDFAERLRKAESDRDALAKELAELKGAE